MNHNPGPSRARSRYVAFCQQLLATAVVMALAVAGAGVLDLKIVPAERPATQGERATPETPQTDAARPGPVADEPIKPKVAQVAVPARAVAAPAPKPVAGASGLRLLATTTPQTVGGLATVGVTWDANDPQPEEELRVDVRTQVKGAWSGWEALEYHPDHGANGSEGSARERAGTEPTVVGHVQQVQFRVLSARATLPRGMRLVLIDPGSGKVTSQAPTLNRPSDRRTSSSAGDLELSASTTTASKPQIFSRAQWGADERIREQGNPSYGVIRTGFVHHTVNANNYTAEQVPALLRGIYAYHVVGRGWRDIGYNFLVDRFGRIWEGRYGGVDKAVVGAHTSGYNDQSFAMSAIGNYDIAQPPQAMLNAYAALFAWKLSISGVRANATGIVVHGKTFQAINGHRDAGSTACPGRYLYAQLPAIRAAALKIQDGAKPTTPTPTPPPGSGSPVLQNPNPPVGPKITPAAAAALPARSSVVGSEWPDLVVRNKTTKKISIVPTGGQLTLSAPVARGGSWSGYDAVVPSRDLTGDGIADLVVRQRGTKAVEVRAGLASGGYAATASMRTTGLTAFTWYAAPGDLDGDKRADLVGGTAAGSVVLLRGLGASRLAPGNVIATGWKGATGRSAGDVNGDGRPDLLRVSSAGVQVVTVRSTGAGGTVSLGAPVSVGGAAGATAVFGGDLTGDGVGDLVVRDGSGATRVAPGRGQSSYGAAMGPFGALSGLASVSVGSVPGRTTPAVVALRQGSLVVVTSNGRSNLGSPVATNLTLPDAGQLVQVGDWNRDGRADLVSRPKNGTNLWLRTGDGKGGFSAMVLLGTGFSQVTQLTGVGDVTGDGLPDLMGKSAAGLMTVWPGNGQHGLKAGFRAPTALRSYRQIGSSLWNATSSTSRVDGWDGSFVPVGGSAGAALRALVPMSRYDWVLGAGDVNGDRVPDLVVRERATGALWLMPGTGYGVTSRRLIGTGFGAYDLVG